MDDKKLGRLCKVEIYNVTRKQHQQNVTKKNYVITIYNKVTVKEKTYAEDGTEIITEKEKFIKWGEFGFQEVMHPKDKIRQFLSKIEMPLNYIPDIELTDELARRELIPLSTISDELIFNEIKRRGLTVFANTFKISKTASLGQRIKAFVKERRKIPAISLSFEDTVKELKERHVILPKDFMTDEELITEIESRGMHVLTNKIVETLFEPEPEPSPVITPPPNIAHASSGLKQEPITGTEEETPLALEDILGKPQ
jgi:hypothetical protein